MVEYSNGFSKIEAAVARHSDEEATVIKVFKLPSPRPALNFRSE